MIFNIPLLDALYSNPPVFYFISLVFGLSIGSFLNVVIYRLPIILKEEWLRGYQDLQGKKIRTNPSYSLISPGSRCPHCEYSIKALDNIPILSFLLIRGRCRSCNKNISLRYPFIELFTGILFVFASHQFGASIFTLYAWVLIALLMALTFIDIDTQLLPDHLTISLLWLGLMINIRGGFVDLESAVIGAVIGYLILWSIFWLFKILTGKEGMGYGDFKLLSALGAWMGWQSLLPIVILSSLIGSIIGICLILLKTHQKTSAIPFGPFLGLAGLVVFFYGKHINQLFILSF
jgi:leader peptidase (prepilin peptidase)/N-methyltransferase